MVVVIDLPGFVADDDVVVLRFDQIDEGQEIARHHLIHGAQGEEGLQVVLAGHRLEVPALVGQAPDDGMQAFAFAFEVGRGWRHGEPVDLKVGLQRAHLACDGQIALHVAEADGAGDEERAALARHAAHPGGA